jgi:cell wall-associated NlpC family hydrolase
MKWILTLLIILCGFTTSAQIPEGELDSKNAELYKFIQSWWKTPYRWGGESKRGVDCSGFTQTLFKTVYDISIPRVASAQYKAGKPISKDEVTTGDLVFFTSPGPSGWHVGFYLVDGLFVHAASKKGVYISSINDQSYEKRLKGFRRIM